MKPGRPLNDEERALAERYFALAVSLALPAARARPDLHDEIFSEAMLTLCRAARGYRPSSPIRFATYARFKILGQIGTLKKNSARRHERMRTYNGIY